MLNQGCQQNRQPFAYVTLIGFMPFKVSFIDGAYIVTALDYN